MSRVALTLWLSISIGAPVYGTTRHDTTGRTSAASQATQTLPLIRVPAGDFAPFSVPTPQLAVIHVPAFLMMTRAVRNAEFLTFVIAHPEYQRDRIASVLADAGYLSHWSKSTTLGPDVLPEQPVTRVSWFAARAFCEAHALRLPTEVEWELAAAASATERDARRDPRFRQRILDWYATPAGALPEVPYGPKNLYGIYDLHAVIWEWVEDFNADIVVSDNRGRAGPADTRFVCGGGSLQAGDSLDYPAFLRYGFRSSLQATFTTASLGFRCARDVPPRSQQRATKGVAR